MTLHRVKSPEQGLADIKNDQGSLLSQSWEVTKKRGQYCCRSNAICNGCRDTLRLSRNVLSRGSRAYDGAWCL